MHYALTTHTVHNLHSTQYIMNIEPTFLKFLMFIEPINYNLCMWFSICIKCGFRIRNVWRRWGERVIVCDLSFAFSLRNLSRWLQIGRLQTHLERTLVLFSDPYEVDYSILWWWCNILLRDPREVGMYSRRLFRVVEDWIMGALVMWRKSYIRLKKSESYS